MELIMELQFRNDVRNATNAGNAVGENVDDAEVGAQPAGPPLGRQLRR